MSNVLVTFLLISFLALIGWYLYISRYVKENENWLKVLVHRYQVASRMQKQKLHEE